MIQELRFDERGLIPAIVQHFESERILMLGYMNAEALALTLQSGETHLWNPKLKSVRRELGSDGKSQLVSDLVVDCDGDALIVKVDPRGPACQTGEESCFHRRFAVVEEATQGVSVIGLGSMELGIMLSEVFESIQERQRERPENSYAAHLFNSGLDTILKKLGEQAVETILAAKGSSKAALSSKVADVFYHLLVLMAERDLDPKDILGELKNRAGRTTENRPAHVR